MDAKKGDEMLVSLTKKKQQSQRERTAVWKKLEATFKDDGESGAILGREKE